MVGLKRVVGYTRQLVGIRENKGGVIVKLAD